MKPACPVVTLPTGRIVTGPYHDAKNRARPWAVTVKEGYRVETERFADQATASAYAGAAKGDTLTIEAA
jgi:hypothetical protein